MPLAKPTCNAADAQIRKCQKRFRKIARQLKRAETQSPAKRRSAERRLLGSHAARVAATVEANGKLRAGLRVGPQEIFKIASLVRPAMPNEEPATLYGKAKSSGGWRAIWNYKLRRKAIGELVKPVLLPKIMPRAFQYDRKGKGVHKAIRGVKQALADGLVYAQRIDIVNHFGSILTDQLSHQLHLRKKIVEHAVSAKHIPLTSGSDVPSLLATTARLGLPQGAGSSPLIAFIITSWLDWKVPHGIQLFNYADDFLVMGASKEDVDAAADALCDAIRSLPGGHFSENPLKRSLTSSVEDGFTFLGHDFETDNGKIIVSPTVTSLDGLYRRIDALENLARAPVGAKPKKGVPCGPDALGEAWVLAKSWRQAFSECNDIADELVTIRMVLEEELSWWKEPPAFLDQYDDTHGAWTWDGYDDLPSKS